MSRGWPMPIYVFDSEGKSGAEQHLGDSVGRGLGKMQQSIVDLLTSVFELHGSAYVLLRSLAQLNPAFAEADEDQRVSTSTMESTRRAVRTLEERRWVETRMAEWGGRSQKVVRLRTEDRPRDLPPEIETALFTKLHIDDCWHNEQLRRLGSRYRRMHVKRPYMELVRLVLPGNDSSTYDGIYLYPAESTSQSSPEPVGHSDKEELIEELTQRAQEEIEHEIQRRVTLELARSNTERSCVCSQKQSLPVETINRDPYQIAAEFVEAMSSKLHENIHLLDHYRKSNHLGHSAMENT